MGQGYPQFNSLCIGVVWNLLEGGSTAQEMIVDVKIGSHFTIHNIPFGVFSLPGSRDNRVSNCCVCALTD